MSNSVRLLLACLIFGVMAPGYLVVNAGTMLQQYDSLTWPAVEGTVLGTEVKREWGGKFRIRYTGYVTYQYTVNGEEYMSDKTFLGSGLGERQRNETEAQADIAQYVPGEPVKVYFDPTDPSLGVLQTGVSSTDVMLNLFLVGVTMVSWLGILAIIVYWYLGPLPDVEPATPDPLLQEPKSPAEQAARLATAFGGLPATPVFNPILSNPILSNPAMSNPAMAMQPPPLPQQPPPLPLQSSPLPNPAQNPVQTQPPTRAAAVGGPAGPKSPPVRRPPQRPAGPGSS